MKKVFNLFFALVAIVAISSCAPKTGGSITKPDEENKGTVTDASNELIPFKERYTTKKNTVVTYNDGNIFAINLRSNVEIKITSNLFSDNVKIVDGKVYIGNSTLDELSTIPAQAIWKATVPSDIRRDGYGVQNLLLTTINEKGMRYTFWFTRTGENTFVLSETTKGLIEYNGQKYFAYAKGNCILHYSVIEGLSPSVTPSSTGTGINTGNTLPPPK